MFSRHTKPASLLAVAICGVVAGAATLGAGSTRGTSAASAVGSASTAAKPLTGGVKKTDLGINLDHYGFCAKPSGSPKFKAVVDGVKLGGPAFYAGMKNGDRIISASAKDKDHVVITFERSGSTYGVTLKGRQPKYDLNVPHDDAHAPGALVMTPQQRCRMLADHEIVVLIDQTESMNDVDCPGKLSRWQWCREQTARFMSEMSPYLRDIDVVTFNTEFHEFKHSDAAEIAHIYRSFRPTGGTNMASPLEAIFHDYFKRKAIDAHLKPLLVAVISDGMPNLPGGPEAAKSQVEQAILDATKHMQKRDEVTVTFMQIGRAYEGADFLKELVEHMPGNFDVVDTKTFTQLQELGLRGALIDAVTERAMQAGEGSVFAQQIKELTTRSRQLHQQLGNVQ